MKNFIQRINRYFLERWPLLWNTRVYWVLFICGLMHILFYIAGYNTFYDTALLKRYDASEIFITNGALLFSIVLSVLILVIWVLILFRNNAFKNFYPTRSGNLFAGFCIYFLVLLASTTFYVSYIAGYKQFIKKHYSKEWLHETIEKANLAAAFLPFDLNTYTLNNRRYPAPFDTLYCEHDEKKIDFSKPYLTHGTEEYQFYTLEKITEKGQEQQTTAADPLEKQELFRETRDSAVVVYFKKEVVDLSGLAGTGPSFYNYSGIYFGPDGSQYYHNNDDAFTYMYSASHMNKAVYELLQRNNPVEIKKILSDFLKLSDQFEIETDLTTDVWFKLIYHPGDFPVSHFINNRGREPSVDISSLPREDIAVTAPAEDPNADSYYQERKTGYYFNAIELERFFNGINSIHTFSVFDAIVYIALWVAFGLASLLLAFRVTNLRLLLFSAITAIVIGILIALITLVFDLANGYNGELPVAYFIFIVGSIILFIPLLFLRILPKSLQGILINITLVGIVPYFLLILLIISLHQRAYFNTLNVTGYPVLQKTILEALGVYWNYILLLAGILFLRFYSPLIRKWRSLPER